MVLERRRAGRELGDEAAAFGHQRGQIFMLRRIGDVESRTEDSDGVAADIEGGAVSDAVDPAGESAQDHVAGPHQPHDE